MYICGKTGTGKSHLLELMSAQDVRAGQGFTLIDPHGDFAERLKAQAFSIDRNFIYLKASDPSTPWRINPLRRQGVGRGRPLPD